MSQPIQNSVAILGDAKKKILEELKEDVHAHNRLIVNTLFDRLFQRFELMGAVLEPNTSVSTTAKLPPLKESLNATPKPNADELIANNEDVLRIRAKAEKLRAVFLELSPQVILRDYTTTDESLAVRSIARKVGVPNYATREWNIEFIADIAEGIKKQDFQAAQLNDINEVVDQAKKETDLQSSLNDDPAITAEEILQDKKIQAINAIPGDRLSVVLAALDSGKQIRTDKERAAFDKTTKTVQK